MVNTDELLKALWERGVASASSHFSKKKNKQNTHTHKEQRRSYSHTHSKTTDEP